MPISMECPSCMNTFTVPDEMAGRKSKCTECQFTLFVPRGDSSADSSAPTPATPPKSDSVPEVTTAETRPVEVVAAPASTKPKRSAIKKPTPTTTKRPPKSDNPFTFDDRPSPDRPRRRSGSRAGLFVLAALLIAGLGGLLLLGGGGLVVWYFISQSAQQRLAEQDAQLAQQKAEESRIAQEREEELRKVNIKKPDDPKNDPPNNPGGKPVRDPAGDPANPGNQANPQKPRIALSCSAIPAAVKPGDLVPFTIRVKRENCQGEVRITLEAPPGALLASSSPSVPAGIDQILASVKVVPNAKGGTYPLKITATLNELTDLQTVEFKVENAVPVNVPPEPDNSPLQFLGGAQLRMKTTPRQALTKAEVLCVALSRDQKTAVSGGRDKVVHVWDVAEMKERFALSGHKADVTGVAISADGNTIASGDANGSLLLWDAKTGKGKQPPALEQLPNENGVNVSRITAVDFAPLGDNLLVCTDTSLRCYSITSGKQLGGVVGPHAAGKFEPAAAFACSLSNGKIATFGWGKGQAEQAYDATADLFAFAPGPTGLFIVDKGGAKVEFSRYLLGKKKTPLGDAPPLGRENAPTCLAVADKAGVAVLGDGKGVLRGLDVTTGKEVFQSDALTEAIVAVAVSVDARRLVTGGKDGTVGFHELMNVKPGDPAFVKREMTLTPLAPLTVKAGGSGTLKVKIVRKECTGAVAVTVKPPPNVLQAPVVGTLPGNTEEVEIPFMVAATAPPGKHTLEVTASIDPLTDTKPFVLTVEKADEPGQQPLQLAVGRIVADGKVYQKHVGSVDCVAISPDKKWAVSGGSDGLLRRWNLEKEEEPKTLHTGQAGLSALAISADGKWIAFGDVRGTIRLISADGKENRALTLDKVPDAAKRLANRVTGLEFSAKGDLLVAGTARYFGCWSVETGKQTQALGTVADCGGVHFAADDTTVYAQHGTLVAVLDARTPAAVTHLGKPVELHTTVFDSYLAKQELIAVVKKDKTGELQRINLKTAMPEKLVGFDTADEIPLRIAVADKAGFVLTGDKQGTIHLWELDMGRDVLKFPPHKGAVHALAVSADGRRAVSGGADGSVRIYDLRNEK